MSSAARFLSPSEAAGQFGVSTKAPRLYEQRGLIIPARTSSGWRAYGPAEMARLAEIVELRKLGLSLGEVAGLFQGDAQTLERTLAVHEATLKIASASLEMSWPKSGGCGPISAVARCLPREN